MQIATEEITKANNVIAQQNRDLTTLKQKLEMRTDIILHQERLLQNKENDVGNLDMTEYSKQLEKLKEKQCQFGDSLGNLQRNAQQVNDKYRKSTL